MTLVDRARKFAKRAHGKQKRKYVGGPYWRHCESVAQIVTDAGGTEAMIAAAWLHDVLEDCDVRFHSLREEFGDEVYKLVLGLTDYGLTYGNRKFRKAQDRERLALAPAEAQTIKLADLIDNTASIVAGDANFARVYLEEKDLLLGVLTKGDPGLRERAYESLREGQRQIVQVALAEAGEHGTK